MPPTLTDTSSIEAVKRRILREEFIRSKLDAANQAILAAMEEIAQTRRAAVNHEIDNSPNPNDPDAIPDQEFSDELYTAYQTLRRAHAMMMDAEGNLFPE